MAAGAFTGMFLFFNSAVSNLEVLYRMQTRSESNSLTELYRFIPEGKRTEFNLSFGLTLFLEGGIGAIIGSRLYRKIS